MKLLWKLDAFNSSDCSNLYNVLSGATAGKVMDRSSQTLNQWTNSFSVSEALNQFVTNVSRLKIREDQDVSFTSYLRARSFSFCYGRNDRSVNCNSPSNLKSTLRSFKMLTASTTLSTSGVEAEPLVEKDNMDTRGSAIPTTLRAFSTVDSAISANCSLVGLGNTPQSEKMSTPSSPYSFCL